MRVVVVVFAIATAASESARADGPRAPASPNELRIAPSRTGRFGAWLVAGPFKGDVVAGGSKPKAKPGVVTPVATAVAGIDERTLAPRVGARATTAATSPSWLLASSGDGPVDVRAALHTGDSDVFAYAAGTVHIEHGGKHLLLLGVDDGVRVFIDGRVVFTHDDARPFRDDDDVVPLDLDAGDHAIVLKLHQRDGAWVFRARIVDAQLAAPRGAYLALPGGTLDDARALAAKMSWVSVDRGVFGGGYAPRVTVKFPEGAPVGAPLHVRVALRRKNRASREDADAVVDAGDVRVDDGVVGEVEAQFPGIAGVGAVDAKRVEGTEYVIETEVAGRVVSSPFAPRGNVREAIARADTALARPAAFVFPATVETIAHLRNRLARLASRGDTDLEAQSVEARELDAAASSLLRGVDPFTAATGPMRRAYLSPVDGELAEFGLYVPPTYKPGSSRRYPLIVALHGLNGPPMAMMRWFFGGDDPKRDQLWEDRHLDALPALDAFVVTPSGHGNTMYRDLGEDDVVRVMDWALAAYGNAIDRTRVTITGPSMGGIGAAAIPFHRPDRFAAAAPLCGYHSYFVRRDMLGRALRPWERAVAEERSNVQWAWNGQDLPLYIVHGTLDTPEANSGVLIDRYEELKYSVRHEHPNLGHNVWQTTYEDLAGAKWLMSNQRDMHPASVRFRTMRLRYSDSAWVHIEELAAKAGAWGEIEARVAGRTRIEAKTKGVVAIRFDRDDKLVDGRVATTVTLDGTRLSFPPAEPIVAHRVGSLATGAWEAGELTHDGPWKQAETAGPIRDVFHAPILFVYGASDPAQAQANEEIARAWASIRAGVTVKYPVISDAEFIARGEALANERALFLVGNARTNRVVRALESDFPIRVDGNAIVAGTERFTGNQLGAAFIRPNPKRADRYVVVVEGIDALGTWRSLSLPELLPDFIVYDDQIAPARGQMTLGGATAKAAGFFQNDWSLPAHVRDPNAPLGRRATPTLREVPAERETKESPSPTP